MKVLNWRMSSSSSDEFFNSMKIKLNLNFYSSQSLEFHVTNINRMFRIQYSFKSSMHQVKQCFGWTRFNRFSFIITFRKSECLRGRSRHHFNERINEWNANDHCFIAWIKATSSSVSVFIDKLENAILAIELANARISALPVMPLMPHVSRQHNMQ